ncbi:MAG: nicotinate-nicotinamide nucleotide adenylyltransferase [Terriglobales bacterium]
MSATTARAAAGALRVGILGGTFDPIHRGHLRLAAAAERRCRLDWVYFVPAARPGHKAAPRASYADRYAMVALALAGRRSWCPLAIPAPPGRLTYSLDQVGWIAQRHSRARLFFILGADAMVEIRSWWRYRRLLAACDFIVAPRAGLGLEAVGAALAGAGANLRTATRPETFRLGRRQVFWLTHFREPAGSRQLRPRLGRAQPGAAASLLPARVAEYLRRGGFYR